MRGQGSGMGKAKKEAWGNRKKSGPGESVALYEDHAVVYDVAPEMTEEALVDQLGTSAAAAGMRVARPLWVRILRDTKGTSKREAHVRFPTAEDRDQALKLASANGWRMEILERWECGAPRHNRMCGWWNSLGASHCDKCGAARIFPAKVKSSRRSRSRSRSASRSRECSPRTVAQSPKRSRPSGPFALTAPVSHVRAESQPPFGGLRREYCVCGECGNVEWVEARKVRCSKCHTAWGLLAERFSLWRCPGCQVAFFCERNPSCPTCCTAAPVDVEEFGYDYGWLCNACGEVTLLSQPECIACTAKRPLAFTKARLWICENRMGGVRCEWKNRPDSSACRRCGALAPILMPLKMATPSVYQPPPPRVPAISLAEQQQQQQQQLYLAALQQQQMLEQQQMWAAYLTLYGLAAQSQPVPLMQTQPPVVPRTPEMPQRQPQQQPQPQPSFVPPMLGASAMVETPRAEAQQPIFFTIKAPAPQPPPPPPPAPAPVPIPVPEPAATPDVLPPSNGGVDVKKEPEQPAPSPSSATPKEKRKDRPVPDQTTLATFKVHMAKAVSEAMTPFYESKQMDRDRFKELCRGLTADLIEKESKIGRFVWEPKMAGPVHDYVRRYLKEKYRMSCSAAPPKK